MFWTSWLVSDAECGLVTTSAGRFTSSKNPRTFETEAYEANNIQGTHTTTQGKKRTDLESLEPEGGKGGFSILHNNGREYLFQTIYGASTVSSDTRRSPKKWLLGTQFLVAVTCTPAHSNPA